MQAVTDTELLLKFREGDENAFRELYDRHSRTVSAFVYHLTHSAVDAEDILQETFLKLWTSREQLPPIDNIGNYIFMIARNKTLDHLRKIAQQQRLLDNVWANISTPADGIEQQLHARESQQLINRAFTQLTEQQQTIFRLSRQEGMTHEAIAQQLRLSKSRVKNVQVETLRYIRQFLVQHGGPLGILFVLASLMKS
ncbi:RNA polymerase, sigma subunit, ECF family [Chitinophaga sp. CF118]|uniref:RNA polymerase sigma factor n=1 Tax=Chitinophaga sp. CF118 TaxID=1884367 RepID=UPI0008DF4860|nr:sigma-70 family RNA polymerase sigma factor [Chitinophaga sp. CF118]SFD09344.1 RNA polymerase, sigma subunit, ECF family [Chitinophaga sp. CF118]